MTGRCAQLDLDVAKHLFEVLIEADHQGALGACESHLDPTGEFCLICTALEYLQSAIWDAEEEEDPA